MLVFFAIVTLAVIIVGGMILNLYLYSRKVLPPARKRY